MKPGEVADFDTSVPHWFGPAGGRPVEILSLLGKQGEGNRRTTSKRSRGEPERWVAVGDEGEGVADDPVVPSHDADHEVEEALRVATGEDDGDPVRIRPR